MNPHRDRTCLLLVAVVCVLVLAWLFSRGCGKAEGAELPEALTSLLARPDVDGWKRDLVRQAVAHESSPFRAHTVYYTPAEAGSDWRRWSHTATGTLVRPGVASCTQANRSRWMGAYIWFAGHGVCHVEDVFPESSSPIMFDLAVWAQPGQSYQDWLTDPSRVAIARSRNVWTDAVVLKPPHGWNQLTSKPK